MPQARALAAHHQAALAVDLEPDHAVDHVHARLLELARPLDIVGLVEPGPQLDQRRHLLAVARGLDERADDGRVAARAIERLLEREHLGIARRLVDEIDDRRERIVRMVQQDVLLARSRQRCARAAAARADAPA